MERKNPMEKIQNTKARNIAFSKGLTGVFKEARELCEVSGAQAAIIVNSPADDKAYVFGHPDAEMVLDRFMNSDGGVNTNAGTDSSVSVQGQDSLPQGSETKQGEVGGFWWDAPAENMGLDELEMFKNSLEELKRKMEVRAAEGDAGKGRGTASEQQVEPAIDE